jgi:hypothetical protein
VHKVPRRGNVQKTKQTTTDLGHRPLRRDLPAGAGVVLRSTTLEQSGWIEQPFLDDPASRRRHPIEARSSWRPACTG